MKMSWKILLLYRDDLKKIYLYYFVLLGWLTFILKEYIKLQLSHLISKKIRKSVLCYLLFVFAVFLGETLDEQKITVPSSSPSPPPLPSPPLSLVLDYTGVDEILLDYKRLYWMIRYCMQLHAIILEHTISDCIMRGYTGLCEIILDYARQLPRKFDPKSPSSRAVSL